MKRFVAQVLVYNETDYIQKAIEPWLDVCERIDVFEGSFQTLRNLGYPSRSYDGTFEKIIEISKNNPQVIPHFTEVFNEPILRNTHLYQTIRDFGRKDTVLFILDADEIYTKEEVQKCINQVETQYNQYNRWWVNFKNYINDENTYYEGFRVPRFAKLENALGFDSYNGILYEDGVSETDVADVLPKHFSWVGLKKCEQKIRWQNSLGWECSFKIENNNIIFNDSYYSNTGKTKPTLKYERHISN